MTQRKKVSGKVTAKKTDSYVFLSDAKRKLFLAQARKWLARPKTMENEMKLNLLVQWQGLNQMAQHPPPGRSGPAIALQAHRAYLELSEVFDEMLEKLKSKKGKGGET